MGYCSDQGRTEIHKVLYLIVGLWDRGHPPGFIGPVGVLFSEKFAPGPIRRRTPFQDVLHSGGQVSQTEALGCTLPDFTSAGIHEICVQGEDERGNTSEPQCILLAVYDPNGGFVTGGGWINSPAGAYVADPALTGKASFGFVSKYPKGSIVPDGNTQFKFIATDLNFNSTSYQWMAIAGARVQYKGIGTINGQGNYGFLLTAIDGEISGGGGVDRFRIKIWNPTASGAIVYDNQQGAADDGLPATALGGGSIVIHK